MVKEKKFLVKKNTKSGGRPVGEMSLKLNEPTLRAQNIINRLYSWPSLVLSPHAHASTSRPTT